MRTGRPKADNAKRKTITVRLSEDLSKKIIEYAAKHNVSKTEVVLQSYDCKKSQGVFVYAGYFEEQVLWKNRKTEA